MKAKPIYKIVDDKGRVLIPKALRSAAEMEHGDIVRLGIHKGVIFNTRLCNPMCTVIQFGDRLTVVELDIIPF